MKKKPAPEDTSKTFSITTIDTYDYYNSNEKTVVRKNVFEPDDSK
jgi:hypothetical protein